MTTYKIVVNVENLEATPFLVINLYDRFLMDQIILPYQGPEQAIERIKELMNQHGGTVVCFTSNRDIYALTLSAPGISGMFKHYDDTNETASSLKDAEEVLRDIYDIEPIVPKPKLPVWRKRLFLWTQKLANKLGGNGNYEI